jgi:hypothetical protein
MKRNERYKIVPTELVANLRFRRDLLLRCQADKAFRDAIWQVCKEDCLFFFNAMCIAEGTLVVTHKGLIPIESVTSSDLVWDGENWIAQGGAIFKGHKDVIDAYGIELTHDHKVFTKHGWTDASEGHERAEVQVPVGGWPSRELCERPSEMALSMRLWESKGGFRFSTKDRQANILRLQEGRICNPRENANVDSQCLDVDAGEMRKRECRLLSTLRRARNQSLRTMARLQSVLCGHGRATEGNDARQNRQQRRLRTRKLPLGHTSRTGEQHSKKCASGDAAWKHDDSSGCERERPVSSGDCIQVKKRRSGGSVVCSKNTRSTRVYDLINCGPREAFTVIDRNGNPLLVHNCWVYEPRPRIVNGIVLPHQMPFIAWEHQVPAILEIKDNLGHCDIGVEKSRGEGMSWMGILLAMHDWLFEDMAAIGFVSKDEVSADDPNDPDSLMWKCDYTLKKLPVWMSGLRDKDWKRDVSKHVLRNLRNESTISAYAATGNVASGGRKKWFLKDELAKFPKPADKDAMASTQHVTNCRLIVSTPKGSDGAYYDVMHEPSNMVRVVLDWKMNPTRNRGLYEFENGIPIAVDPINNPLPPHYDPPTEDVLDMFSRLRRKGFKLEGKQRSPWYDRECDRAGASPQNIAQELDRDYGGSAYRIMGDAFISKVEGTAREWVLEGDADFDMEKLDHFRFNQTLGGPLKLWIPIDVNGNPPRSQFVIGGDVAAGTGGSYSSNSTLWGLDLLTGEQVLEYASNTIAPSDFADLAIALSKWLHGAYLAWEANGPGTSFTKQVISRRYEHVFMRKSISRFGRTGSKELGWWTDERSKEIMFDDMRKSVVMNEIVIRSKDTLQEFGKYVRKDGKIQHALVKNAVDDSKGSSHGDRAIAACVCLQAVKDRPLGDKNYDENREAPEGTMAWRMRQYEQSLVKDDVWDNGIFVEPF